MKTLITALALCALFGCAQTGILSDSMQPDHSYRIIAGGNVVASGDDVRDTAQRRAKFLCPNGYETKSQLLDNSPKPRYMLIVMCN
jgi:hypothetical protein